LIKYAWRLRICETRSGSALVFIDAVVFGIGVVYFEEEGRWW
jgi:hypothetical protein